MQLRHALFGTLLIVCISCSNVPQPRTVAETAPATVFAAALNEPNASADVSTAEMEALVASRSAIVLDTRPHLEWSVSHIPTALNVAPKPGAPMSLYVSDVAEIERLTGGDKSKPLVLYCNGPFCGKAKRVERELIAAGFKSVRRYQLGAPVWRALGKPMIIEPDAIPYVLGGDATAVFVDARDAAEFAAGSVRGAKNIPRSLVVGGYNARELQAAKDDSRLPMNDHNTRIVVFGRDGQQARELAEAITGEAFHNVVFFNGTYDEFARAAAIVI